jgi:hypothetical protein
MYVSTTNLCAKFQIIPALRFSRIIITQIVNKITQNEKRLNALHSNRAKKSITIRFSIYFNVYFLTIFAYISVKSVPAHLCKKFKRYVFRLLNLLWEMKKISLSCPSAAFLGNVSMLRHMWDNLFTHTYYLYKII